MNSIDSPLIIANAAVPQTAEQSLLCPPLHCRLTPSTLTCLVGPHRAQLRAYLLMLAGIVNPAKGDIEVLGQAVNKLTPQTRQQQHRHIGYLSGSAPLLSTQPALMNVMLPLLYHDNLPFREAAAKVESLLAELGSEVAADAYPAVLNSFQRLQLALARAVILDPRILVLDVPFNDLGAHDRQKAATLLAKQKRDRILCMIGGLQYPHFLEQHADQLIFINERQIITFPGWQTFCQAENPEVRAFLDIM